MHKEIAIKGVYSENKRINPIGIVFLIIALIGSFWYYKETKI